MSRELQDQLARIYPQIFGDLSFPTFPPSCSLACGDEMARTSVDVWSEAAVRRFRR